MKQTRMKQTREGKDPNFKVGSKNFFEVPKNLRRDGSPREGTYMASRFGHGRFDYSRPINKDGSYATYFKILVAVAENPGSTRNDILYDACGDKCISADGKVRAGYLSTYFAGLHGDGFFRISTKGEYYPTEKCVEFIKDAKRKAALVIESKVSSAKAKLFESILKEAEVVSRRPNYGRQLGRSRNW